MLQPCKYMDIMEIDCCIKPWPHTTHNSSMLSSYGPYHTLDNHVWNQRSNLTIRMPNPCLDSRTTYWYQWDKAHYILQIRSWKWSEIFNKYLSPIGKQSIPDCVPYIIKAYQTNWYHNTKRRSRTNNINHWLHNWSTISPNKKLSLCSPCETFEQYHRPEKIFPAV